MPAKPSGADHLFESAPAWHGAGTSGIILIGLRNEGMAGTSMPSNVLINDHFEDSVVLLAKHLSQNEKHAHVKVPDPGNLNDLPSVAHTPGRDGKDLLRQSIGEVLRLIREDLVMDMVLITIHMGDNVTVSQATTAAEEATIEGMSHASDQSICQRVLDGRLPAVIPDVAALKHTHDVPVTPIVPGAFMAVPILLSGGERYGVLCCLRSTPMLELDQLHLRRLQMSAQHIARLVDEAG